jgi:aminopeptidase YwaD
MIKKIRILKGGSKLYLKMQSYVFAFFLFTSLHAQDVKEAHRVVDTLASPVFWGRGYVDDGHIKAARFISDRFEQIGLAKLGSDYFQKFDFTINVFDGPIFLKSKKRLLVGQDFIPNADCPPFKGRLRVRKYDSTKVYSFKDIVLMDKKQKVALSMNTITLSGKKLTHTFAQRQSKLLGFQLLDSSVLKLGKTLKVNLKSNLKSVISQNVLGYVRGTISPDSFLVVCAHYDHLGGIGKQCYFPGANDNASGIAMLLQLASYYSKPQNYPKYSVLFIAFGAEEAGLLGSKYYVDHPLVPLKQTKFVLNLDLMGSGLEGITVVNGSVFSKEFETLQKINEANHLLKVIKPRGKAANSDHYHFSENGVKSFFIYSLGEITAYHDINDTADKVPLSRFSEMYHLIVEFLGTF